MNFSGDDNLDTARAYYGLGCALKELGSTQEALKNLKKAREIQYHVIASKEDIERTEQEIKGMSACSLRASSPIRASSKVVSDTLGRVDFIIDLVNSVLC